MRPVCTPLHVGTFGAAVALGAIQSGPSPLHRLQCEGGQPWKITLRRRVHTGDVKMTEMSLAGRREALKGELS